MTFANDLNKHLARYKTERLGIKESGVFSRNGRAVAKIHILPKARAKANLFREAQCIFHDFPKIVRHKYFHHLNSSQAFAFNLFYPYFSSSAAAQTLFRTLGGQGTFAGWEPEAIPDLAEGTNVDVRWWNDQGSMTFCEVKLSEREFGKARADSRHSDKLKHLYSARLTGHVKRESLEPDEFFDGYQFYRNVWHLVGVQGSTLVFLLPRANSQLWQQLTVLLESVSAPTRARISAIAVEDLLEDLCSDDHGPNGLRTYAEKLREKYIPVVR